MADQKRRAENEEGAPLAKRTFADLVSKYTIHNTALALNSKVVTEYHKIAGIPMSFFIRINDISTRVI
jgi:hypothetical protein